MQIKISSPPANIRKELDIIKNALSIKNDTEFAELFRLSRMGVDRMKTGKAAEKTCRPFIVLAKTLETLADILTVKKIEEISKILKTEFGKVDLNQ